MKQRVIRTTVGIPASLYRRLKDRASAQGKSVREVILASVRAAVWERRHSKATPVRFPLIASDGPKVNLTNEQIYSYIQFP